LHVRPPGANHAISEPSCANAAIVPCGGDNQTVCGCALVAAGDTTVASAATTATSQPIVSKVTRGC
jgi:hypothetical protein